MKTFDKYFSAALISILGAISSASAVAASSNSGKVVKIYVTQSASNHAAIVRISGVATGSGPTCATSSYGSGWSEYAFSTDTAFGKAMLAEVIHAQIMGVNLTVTGDGACNAWGDRESVTYVLADYP